MVSVVIITYKRPVEILFRAINSVLNQSFTDFEIIIVNDAPEEKELASTIRDKINILNDNRIKYVEHEMNRGANFARNTGLKRARGKFVAFLDDDDEWLDNKLELQVKQFDKNKELGLVYCGFKIVCGNTAFDKKTSKSKGFILNCLLEENFIGSTSFPLLSKRVLDELGGFDTNLKSCQEYELWIRVAQHYKIDCVEDILGVYHISSDSTFKGNYASYIEGDTELINKHIKLFKDNPINYSNHLLNMAMYFFRKKQLLLAIRYKLQAFFVCPYNYKNISLLFLLSKLYNKKFKGE